MIGVPRDMDFRTSFVGSWLCVSVLEVLINRNEGKGL